MDGRGGEGRRWMVGRRGVKGWVGGEGNRVKYGWEGRGVKSQTSSLSC